jgi:hypothetical protein
MSRLFRAALENANSSAQTLVMQGPLGGMITQALNAKFSKEAPEGDAAAVAEPTEDVNIPALESFNHALETQAIDAMMMSRIAQAIAPNPEPASVLTVYGVSEKETTPEDVVEVAKLVGADDTPENQEFALIIDGNGPQGASADATVEYAPLNQALESIAQRYNVPVFRNFRDFVQHRYG